MSKPRSLTARIVAVQPLDSVRVPALLTVQIGGTLFYECRATRNPTSPTLIILPPMECWLDAQGKRRYRALAVWSRPVKEAIQRAALAFDWVGKGVRCDG